MAEPVVINMPEDEIQLNNMNTTTNSTTDNENTSNPNL